MIGVIADDVTGATDVAAVLRDHGIRTLLAFGIPPADRVGTGFGAIVVALKTRNLPAPLAVAQSVAALDWLQRSGVERFYFKYCSTFDSTYEGNIGPVTEAFAARLNVPIVVTTPSSPQHGRTVYLGHLFVGDTLLAESHMRHHPLTPMEDSSVPRMLQAQSESEVGLIRHETIRGGSALIRNRISVLAAEGIRQVVADAVDDDDLASIATALEGSTFSAGAAGLISGIAATHPPGFVGLAAWGPQPAGRTAILAGSCSRRTLEQIESFRSAHPTRTHQLDSSGNINAKALSAIALDWFDSLDTPTPALIYSSLPPEQLEAIQARVGREAAGILFEGAAAMIAKGLIQRNVSRLVVAGGETSGAVVAALGIEVAEVGPDAAPGVPWIRPDGTQLELALKSGNFGEADLFTNLATEVVATATSETKGKS
jgi:uncharacterized protein YgbK (DUF1537 family)